MQSLLESTFVWFFAINVVNPVDTLSWALTMAVNAGNHTALTASACSYAPSMS